MAKATKANKQVEVVTTEVQEVVTLELSRVEAEVLYTLAARVGGSLTGPRRKADSILKSLSAIGIDQGHLKSDQGDWSDPSKVSGSIQFT